MRDLYLVFTYQNLYNFSLPSPDAVVFIYLLRTAKIKLNKE